jgi:ELWxxDGT repeat protein
MPAKRSLTLALALLLVASIPARATGFPPITVVDTINPGPADATPLWDNGRLGDYLYFNADDGVHGGELWRTNGTATNLVTDINTTSAGESSFPYSFAALGDYLYFNADDGVHGRELWRTNGTDTNLVSNIASELVSTNSSSPSEFTVLGNWLYFSAGDGAGGHGVELWRTNGTITEMVDDIQLGSSDSSPQHLKVFGGYLYFAADDGVHGSELWRTNGTTTEMVKNIAAEPAEPDSSYPAYLTVFGNYLYFAASDVAGGHGRELWRTDGTAAHTQMVKDINTGGDSSPENLAVFNGYLYFAADSGLGSGVELWRSDGTVPGTVLFKDINPGSGFGYPSDFTRLGTHLYFAADDGTHGRELWWTDGISGADAHTALIQDINLGTSGADGAYPHGLKAHGDYVYFTAYDGTNGLLGRVSEQGVVESTVLAGTNTYVDCMCSEPIFPLNGRLFLTTHSNETGSEFAYLDEPTWVMPSANRDGSPWSTALVVLAAVTAAAGLTVRLRAARK